MHAKTGSDWKEMVAIRDSGWPSSIIRMPIVEVDGPSPGLVYGKVRSGHKESLWCLEENQGKRPWVAWIEKIRDFLELWYIGKNQEWHSGLHREKPSTENGRKTGGGDKHGCIPKAGSI